jgi:hypothetical protein
MQCKEITVSYENRMEHIPPLCKKNARILNVKGDGTYSNHCALEGKTS